MPMAIDHRPILRLIPYLIIAHAILWTIMPSVFHANLQRDQIEGFAWGYEWQWGYAKHPPLWAWSLEATTFITGAPSAIAAYAMGAASGAVAMFFVWRLALRLCTPVGAAIAVMLLEGVLYLNFRTVDFNANVVMLPAWAAAGFFLHRALVDDRLWDWIGLGLALSLGLYGKYATGVLIVPIIVFLVLEPHARARLFSVRPWMGAAIGMAALMPHVMWLVDHGLQPVDYAMARTGHAVNWLGHLTQPILFLAKQVPEILGFVILGAALVFGRTDAPVISLSDKLSVLDQRMIWMLTLGPLIVTAFICGALGRPFVAAWGLPMFCFVGVALVTYVGQASSVGVMRFWRALPAVVGVIVVSFAAYYAIVPELRNRPSKTQFPGAALARAVDQEWAKAAGDAPLLIVAGPIYVAGNAAFHLSRHGLARPHVLIDGDLRQSPWISPALIKARGMVMVWLDEGHGVPDYVAEFPDAVVQPSVSLPFDGAPGLAPLSVGIAVLPPQAD